MGRQTKLIKVSGIIKYINQYSDMPRGSNFNSTESWDDYLRLEQDVNTFIHYVPLTNEHYNVWSPYLADLLLRIGSNVDSFCKNAIFDSTFDNDPDVEECRKKVNDSKSSKKVTIKDYQKIFEKFYNLSSKRVVVIRPHEVIVPFEGWENQESPTWWSDYNSVKHDRHENKKTACLKPVIFGLAALFLLHVAHLETRQLLIDSDFFSLRGTPKERAKEVVLKKPEPIEGNIGYIISGKTSLFGYVFEYKMRPVSDTTRIKFFLPSTPAYDPIFMQGDGKLTIFGKYLPKSP